MEYKNSNVKINFSFSQNIKIQKKRLPYYRLQTVVSNLINNAVEAYPKSEIDKVINITLGASDKNNMFKLEIVDFGRGFSKNLQESIFDAGFTLSKNNGKGLGLFLAKNLINELSGRIWMDSFPGKGTRVTLEF